MPILPGATRPGSNQDRAALALRNVRPIERTVPAAPTAVDPVLAEIARTRPGYTTATVDGRPVVIYIERDRLRWAKLGGLCAAIAAPLVGVIVAGAYTAWAVVGWLVDNGALILGALTTAVVIGFVLRALTRAGVCCPGLHCPGCGHR